MVEPGGSPGVCRHHVHAELVGGLGDGAGCGSPLQLPQIPQARLVLEVGYCTVTHLCRELNVISYVIFRGSRLPYHVSFCATVQER